jgi:hypothetical protein
MPASVEICLKDDDWYEDEVDGSMLAGNEKGGGGFKAGSQNSERGGAGFSDHR